MCDAVQKGKKTSVNLQEPRQAAKNVAVVLGITCYHKITAGSLMDFSVLFFLINRQNYYLQKRPPTRVCSLGQMVELWKGAGQVMTNETVCKRQGTYTTQAFPLFWVCGFCELPVVVMNAIECWTAFLF